MNKGLLEVDVILYILTGISVGFLGRWWMLRGDIRQYPTYPNGYLIHLTTGFIAAAIGAIAYPALLAKNYVAVTFLVLAIQQFREIRKMERDSLMSIEREEYVPRGNAYIDSIAKTFEARNYIVMISSLVTTVIIFVLKKYIKTKFVVIGISAFSGIIILYLLKNYTRGKHLRDIITIEEASLEFREENNLYVGDTYVMNIGLSATKSRILKHGIGFILKPKGISEKIIINSKSQQTALIHECSRLLGLERYVMTRRNFDTGEVAFMIVPINKDIDLIKNIIYNFPILENLKKKEDKKGD